MVKLRRMLALWAFVLMSLVSFAQENLVAKTSQGDEAAKEKFQFAVDKKLPATDVKNQAKSSTCWSYSGLSLIESEMLRMGKKPADLAEMFVVYKVYQDKADKYVRLHGNLTFAPGAEGSDVFDVIRKYGIVPQEVYEGLIPGETTNNHNEMDKKLAEYVKEVASSKVIRGDWKKGFDGILDAYLGSLPQEFTYQGKKYTPRTFADKVVGINPDDYIYITSWACEPYYEKIQLLVPDNWAWEKFYNIPLDDMMRKIDHALDNGYTILWAADVSEKGFSSKLGVGVVPQIEAEDMLDGPKPEKEITEQMRQQAFDDYTTQDDHGMHIIGTAKDQNGKKYYLVKNSWGTERGRDGGMVYVSEAYVRYKTTSIILHKDGVPDDITKKLK